MVYILILAAVAVLILEAFSYKLETAEYNVSTDKIDGEFSIALISDLHSSVYGKDHFEILNLLSDKNIDIVCFTGDIFHERPMKYPDSQTWALLEQASRQYDCYYVPGNHEFKRGDTVKLLKKIDEIGITILMGERASVTVGDDTVDIWGVTDPNDGMRDFQVQLKAVEQGRNGTHYTVLLAHRNTMYEAYAQTGADLVLCGHAHGGQWRLPYVKEGFFTPEHGFFPKYTSGMYDIGRMKMIVSNGLAAPATTLYVPRLFNRPQIVIVDISGVSD